MDTNNQYARSGRLMFIVAWVLFFALMFFFFLYYNNDNKGSFQMKNSVLTIQPDKIGHYQVAGTINDKPVKFIVDTGATLVAIPNELAWQLKLPRRYPISMQTANGQVTGSLTRIEKLTFADFILKDVKAVIMPGDDNVVLLGMNVLSAFDLSQQEGKLVIKKPR